jgi:hypothetical protein
MRTFRSVAAVATTLCGVMTTAVVHAQAAAPAATGDHATGLLVQGRLQTQGGLLSLGAGPGFLVGYQMQSLAVGLGVGATRLAYSTKTADASAVLVEVMPTAVVDVWRSADGRARANLVGGIGYAHASVASTTQTQTCVPSATGAMVCTESSAEDSAGATLIPFMIGFGGDYYISRNFALGAEVGLSAAILAGANTTSQGTSTSQDLAGNMQLAYGAIRASFVLGD